MAELARCSDFKYCDKEFRDTNAEVIAATGFQQTWQNLGRMHHRKHALQWGGIHFFEMVTSITNL
jgi:hypothetical protein